MPRPLLPMNNRSCVRRCVTAASLESPERIGGNRQRTFLLIKSTAPQAPTCFQSFQLVVSERSGRPGPAEREKPDAEEGQYSGGAPHTVSSFGKTERAQQQWRRLRRDSTSGPWTGPGPVAGAI